MPCKDTAVLARMQCLALEYADKYLLLYKLPGVTGRLKSYLIRH